MLNNIININVYNIILLKLMIVINEDGNLVEININDYLTDTEYYNKLIKIITN